MIKQCIENQLPRRSIAVIGCSFTNYVWPSYADVLEADNYGLSGIGNDRIWYTLLHLYKTKQLELYDGIVIQWTSPYRFDYRTPCGWTPNDGNISTSVQNADIWKNIQGWYNETYELERTENFILASKALIKDVGIKSYHMSMTDDVDALVNLSNLKKRFQLRYSFKKAPWTNKPFNDEHPTLLAHIEIAKHIANYFSLKLDKKIIKKCINFHNTIKHTDDYELLHNLYISNFPKRYIDTDF